MTARRLAPLPPLHSRPVARLLVCLQCTLPVVQSTEFFSVPQHHVGHKKEPRWPPRSPTPGQMADGSDGETRGQELLAARARRHRLQP